MEVLSCPRKGHILKLTKENNELVSATHRLKLTAPDGKKRLTDTLDSEGIIKLAKNFPNNRAAIPFHRKKHAPQKINTHQLYKRARRVGQNRDLSERENLLAGSRCTNRPGVRLCRKW